MSLWGHYEERVRLGCEAFEGFARRNGFRGEVDPRLVKEWARGMREWLEVCGEDWTLLGRAVDYMRGEKLLIKSPQSCITVAREMRDWSGRSETEAGRQAYADALREAQGGQDD